MSKEIKVIIIAGARPNFMKVAPIIKHIRGRASDPARNGSTVTYKAKAKDKAGNKSISKGTYDLATAKGA